MVYHLRWTKLGKMKIIMELFLGEKQNILEGYNYCTEENIIFLKTPMLGVERSWINSRIDV